MLCDALERAGLRGYRDRCRRRLAVPGADGERSTCPTERGARAARDARRRRDFVGLEHALARLADRRRGRVELLMTCRSCAAARTCSHGPRRRLADAVAGLRGDPRAARRPMSAARVIFDLGLVAQHRLLHGSRVRGLRPGARRADRRRRPLRRPAGPVRARAAGGRLRARASSGCTWRWPARSAGPARWLARLSASDERRTGLTIAGSARRPASRRRSTCSSGSAWRPRELRTNDRKLLFEDDRRDHDAPVRRADLCGGRRCRHRHHRQGRADGAGRRGPRRLGGREVYELLDLGFGRCTMVLATSRRPGPRGRGAAPAGRDARRDQVPAHRRPPHRGAPGARPRSSRSRARSSWRR